VDVPAASSRPQQGRLRIFLALSVAVHVLAVLAATRPPGIELSIPAPDLNVRLTTPHRSAPTTTAATTVVARAVANPPTTEVAEPKSADRTTSPSDAATNHLRTLLHGALNRHFLYPAVARRNGWQGQVDLVIRLDPDGHLSAIRVVRSSGYTILDQDAVLTMRKIGSIPEAQPWLRGHSGYDAQLPVLYRLTEG
jgi:protein TonB